MRRTTSVTKALRVSIRSQSAILIPLLLPIATNKPSTKIIDHRTFRYYVSSTPTAGSHYHLQSAGLNEAMTVVYKITYVTCTAQPVHICTCRVALSADVRRPEDLVGARVEIQYQFIGD